MQRLYRRTTKTLIRQADLSSLGADVRFLKLRLMYIDYSLRKHVYSNILTILQPKKEIFHIQNTDSFHIPAQNIDCGYSLEPPRRGGSNE